MLKIGGLWISRSLPLSNTPLHPLHYLSLSVATIPSPLEGKGVAHCKALRATWHRTNRVTTSRTSSIRVRDGVTPREANVVLRSVFTLKRHVGWHFAFFTLHCHILSNKLESVRINKTLCHASNFVFHCFHVSLKTFSHCWFSKFFPADVPKQ